MECLETLLIQYTGIEELPSSIRYLVGLTYLTMDHSNVMKLPDSIYQLQNLEELNLSDCSELVEFPKLLQPLPLTNTKNSNDGSSWIAFRSLQGLILRNCAVLELNVFRTFGSCVTLTCLDLSGSDIVTIPPCIKRFVELEFLELENCKKLEEILALPPNITEVKGKGCVSLAKFLEDEPERSQLSSTSSLGKSVLTEVDRPLSLKHLDLSSSAIVSLPARFDEFVGLQELLLQDCKQLREIPKFPPHIKKVYARGCTSLERCIKIYSLSKLRWIDFSICHALYETIRDDVQIHLWNEGHPKYHRFTCVFPGNEIPDWFSYRQNNLNDNSYDLHIDEILENDEITRIAFSAIIEREDIQGGQDEERDPDQIAIIVTVVSDGKVIYCPIVNDGDYQLTTCYRSLRSDQVWLHSYVLPKDFKLKRGDNLQVHLTCEYHTCLNFRYVKSSKPVFFKSCGFHLIRKHEEKVIDLIQPSKRRRDDEDDENDDDDDGNLKSNCYPQQKRHSSTPGT